MEYNNELDLGKLSQRIEQQKAREAFEQRIQQIANITNNRDYSWIKDLQIGDVVYINHTDGVSDPDNMISDSTIFHNCTPIKIVPTPDEFLDTPQTTTNMLYENNSKFQAGTGFIFTETQNTEYQAKIYRLLGLNRPLLYEDSLIIFWKDPRVVGVLGEANTNIEVKKFNASSRNNPHDWYFITSKPLKYNLESNKFEEMDS